MALDGKTWEDCSKESYSSQVCSGQSAMVLAVARRVVLSDELSILESCILRPMIRNSVSEELGVRRFAVSIQESKWCGKRVGRVHCPLRVR